MSATVRHEGAAQSLCIVLSEAVWSTGMMGGGNRIGLLCGTPASWNGGVGALLLTKFRGCGYCTASEGQSQVSVTRSNNLEMRGPTQEHPCHILFVFLKSGRRPVRFKAQAKLTHE